MLKQTRFCLRLLIRRSLVRAQLGEPFASAIYTLATVIVVSGIVAFVVARKWGRTKRARQAIYSVVGFVGLVIAVIVMQYRLQHIG